MHEKQNSMKKLLGDCVSWLVLLTGAAQLLLVCGDGSSGMLCLTFMTSANQQNLCSVHVLVSGVTFINIIIRLPTLITVR